MPNSSDAQTLKDKFSQINVSQDQKGQITSLALGDCTARLEGVSMRRLGRDAYFTFYMPGPDGHDIVNSRLNETAGIEAVAQRLVEIAARKPRL